MEIVKTYIVVNQGLHFVYPAHNQLVKIHLLANGHYISENNKGVLSQMSEGEAQSLINPK